MDYVNYSSTGVLVLDATITPDPTTGAGKPAAAVENNARKLGDHLVDEDNPHETTAAQVGAYTTGQTDTLIAGRAAVGHTHALASGDLTGVLTVAKGGTGLSSIASGKLLYASAANTLAELTLGTGLSITSGTLNATGGGGSPGGSSGQVQYNAAGSFGGDAGLTYDAATDKLTVAGAVAAGSVTINGGVGLSHNSAFGYDYLTTQALTSGQGIVALYYPHTTGTGYVFQFSTKAPGVAGQSLIIASDGADAIVSTDAVSGGSQGKLKFRTGGVWNSDTNTRLTIDSAGKVGIGTAAPAESLHVAGTVAVTGSLYFGGAASANVTYRGTSSTQVREIGQLSTTWIVSTDATRRGLVSHSVYDLGSREYLRGITDGSRGFAVLACHTTPPADADVPDNSLVLYVTGGVVKAKYRDGSSVVTNLTASDPASGTIPPARLAGIVAVGTTSGTYTADASAGYEFRMTINGNLTLANPTNPTDGQGIVFRVTQDATGGRTISFGTKFRFKDGTTPTFTTTASKTTYIGCEYVSGDDKWDVFPPVGVY